MQVSAALRLPTKVGWADRPGSVTLAGVDPVQIHLVRRSFADLERQSHVAALEFYRRLFAAYPQLRPMFSTEIEEQACKLMEMLSLTISLLERPATLDPELEQLGARHVRYGVRDAHYTMVAEALFGMLRQVLGPRFTPEVESAWQTLYATMRDAMLRGASGVTPGSPS